MKISALNRKLHRAFGGRVTAALEDNCIVLRGELGRWDDVVRAGQMAATKYATCHVVNDITFTGGKDAPMRVPALHDDALDGQTPDVLPQAARNVRRHARVERTVCAAQKIDIVALIHEKVPVSRVKCVKRA